MKIAVYLTCLFLTLVETVCASQSTRCAVRCGEFWQQILAPSSIAEVAPNPEGLLRSSNALGPKRYSSKFTKAGRVPHITFCSQASQDAFVYTLLYCVEKKPDKGYYLEIGAADPIITSNTYFLEKKLHWEGASIELNPQYQKDWAQKRRNRLFVADATQTDYSLILKSFPKVIDYLSLDVDGQYDIVLNKIPFDQYTFKIITIEHDFYHFGKIYKEKEREILTSLGYQLLCPDVSYRGVGSFEDWWIHPVGFTEENFKELISLDLDEKYHDEIISILINRFHFKAD